jgi:hypothetical protein
LVASRRVLSVVFVRVRVIRTPTTRDATQKLGYHTTHKSRHHKK